jgi:L-ribulokinase
MKMQTFTLGLDFGTESARAVLVDVATGECVATAVHAYADGVIDAALPGGGALPADWALQNPADWLDATEWTIDAVLAESGVRPEAVVGVGIDFTACTILPTTADGTPLCALDAYRAQPHAWPKLWKHHAAQAQADRINALAEKRGEPWLSRYGGKISSEWAPPKALQIAEEAPEIYAAADRLVEGGDWVVWQLTGALARNTCAAGYKAVWHKREGVPAPEFLTALDPSLVDLYEIKLAGPRIAPGQRVGGLTEAWARRLGLAAGTAVAAPIIDAHAGAIGGGVGGPGVLYLAMGTSTCHMLMTEGEVLVPGISGVVEDGIVPGLFGYEAGQAGVGDIFAWYVEHAAPPDIHAAADGRSVHDVLAKQAAALRPGQSGLLALDWWNGCRSTLVDADLSGLVIGYTLATTPAEIYRALIEATAFGTRVIVDAFTQAGLSIDALLAGGGLTKNPLLMQIYADVTGYPIAVAGAEQASAVGAAILGAVAAGEDAGGYASIADAVGRMAPPPEKVYRPIDAHRAPYDTLYVEYCRLYDYFGRGANPVMKVLRQFRRG